MMILTYLLLTFIILKLCSSSTIPTDENSNNSGSKINNNNNNNNNNVISANDLISFQNFLLLGKEDDKIKSAEKFEEKLRDLDNQHQYSNVFDNNEYKLSLEQIQFYKLYGFLIIKNVFNSDTIISYLSTIWTAIRTQTNSQAVRGPFITDTNLWMKSKKLSEFLLSKKLAKLAAEVMNVKGVRMYQDKPFFKGPNEANSPPHQDRYGTLVRSEHHKMIAAWMPLSFNISTKTGALLYLPGSHRKRKLYGKGFSFGPCPNALNEPDSIWKDEVKIRNMTSLAEAAGMIDAHKWIKFKGFQGSCGATFISPFIDELKPGDIAFHDGFLVHASSQNTNDHLVRAAMSIQYFEDGSFRDSVMQTPTNNFTNDGASQRLWGDKIEKGDKLTSKYTPLLYHITKPHLVGVEAYKKMKEEYEEVEVTAFNI